MLHWCRGLRECFVLLCVLGALGVSLPAAAAEEDEYTAGQGVALEEVVVTALRRETKLIDTPLSLSVLTADDIQRQRIVDFNDLQLGVPNLIFTQVTRQETFLSIRGTGVGNDTPGSDMGVAVFIDGVPRTGVHDYYPDLFDLQSVEVLRGPQGTLFGRNTTGGAVLIHTRAPTFDPTYKAQITYGNFNLAEGNAYVNGPLIADTLAGKLVVNLHRRDGYVTNVTLNRDDGAEKSGSLRGQLMWTPTESVRALFGADYLRDRSESRIGSLEGTFTPSLMPGLRFGPDYTNEAAPPRGSNTIVGLLANIDWDMPLGRFTSISGYRSVTAGIDYSAVADPFNEILASQIVRDRQYSQEFHLASNAAGHWTWLAGLFYLHVTRLDSTLYTANPVPGTLVSFALPPGGQSLQSQDVLTTSGAAFGEATYSFTDSLRFTAGGRYSKERRSGHTEITPTEASGPYAHSWSAFTPKGTLSYKPGEGVFTYFTVSKGFQSGGFDAAAGTNEGLRTPFNPETVLNYELGVKADLLDHRFSFNGDVYWEDYDNLQRTAFDANPAVNAYRTTNAGKARVRGIETDATYLPIEWLRLSGDYAYTDARYRSYLALQDNGSIADYSGNVLPQTPKNQLHVGAEVTLPWVTRQAQVILGADYTYRSAIQFVDANDTPRSIVDKSRYDGIVNLRAEWRSRSGRWLIDLFAKNVTDKRALVNFPEFTPYFATPDEIANPQNHIYLARYSPVRSYGISFTINP